VAQGVASTKTAMEGCCLSPDILIRVVRRRPGLIPGGGAPMIRMAIVVLWRSYALRLTSCRRLTRRRLAMRMSFRMNLSSSLSPAFGSR
jgi:hypothetical protein